MVETDGGWSLFTPASPRTKSGLWRHTWPPWLDLCLYSSFFSCYRLPPKCSSKTNCPWVHPVLLIQVLLGPFLLPGCPSYSPHLADSCRASILGSTDIFSEKPSPPKPAEPLPYSGHTQHILLKISLCCVFLFCCPPQGQNCD